MMGITGKIMKYIPLLFLLSVLISACGSESTPQSNSIPEAPISDQNATPDSFGYLLDSAVEGLRYKSADHYGVTGSDGRFGYMFDENIEFYIGNSLIAYSTTPKEQLTPYEFSNESPFGVLDVLRILQSLDDDGDPSNGIKITEALHQLAESVPLKPTLDFNFPPDEINPDVILELTSVTKAGARGVISKYDAYIHFASTLDSLIDGLEEDIQLLAAQTTCVSSDQCVVTELDTKFTFYCPPAGPSIIYSNNNIDQLRFDELANERNYLINAKYDIESAAGAADTSTGICITNNPPITLLCNTSNYCEIEI